MSWKNFAIFCAIVLFGIFVAIFTLNFSTKNIISNQIEIVQEDIKNRDDGSSLIYEELDTKSNSIRIDRIVYKDGSTGASLALFDIEAKANKTGLAEFRARRFERVNANGQMLTADNIVINDIQENPSAEYAWNQVLFSYLQAENLNMQGITENSDQLVTLSAEQIVLDELTPEELNRFALQDLNIQYSPDLSAHLDRIEVSDFDYGQIETIMNSIEAGYIPVKSITQIAGADLTMQGFALDVEGNDINGSNLSKIDQERLLQLFLDNAPDELTAILGDDAGELTALLEELSKQDPNDLAIGAMETMLNWLKSQNQ